MPILAAIPLWAWLTGGALVGTAVVTNQATDLVDETGQAIEAGTDLTKWLVVAGGLYVSFRVAKTAGLIK